MRRIPRRLPEGVLETSAWVAAYRAEVAANLLDLFRLVVPETVADEVTRGHPDFPQREYPRATLFRQLRPRMLVVPAAQSPAPLPLFGAGEAAAVPLALSRRAILLVNERPAAEHAVSLGLTVVTIPAVVVILHVGGVISRAAAHQKLDVLTRMTTSSYVDRARDLIDQAGLP